MGCRGERVEDPTALAPTLQEALSARILAEEHRIYPDAIGRVLTGRWRIDGRRVTFL